MRGGWGSGDETAYPLTVVLVIRQYICYNTQKNSLKGFYYDQLYANRKIGEKEYMEHLCLCNLPELELKYFALWNLFSYPNICVGDYIIPVHAYLACTY